MKISRHNAGLLPHFQKAKFDFSGLAFFVRDINGKMNLFKMDKDCGDNSIISFGRNANAAAFDWPDAINVMLNLGDIADKIYGFIGGKILFDVIILKNDFINEIGTSFCKEIQ